MFADDLVKVRVRDCPDGSHPDGDHAYLHPRATPEIGFAANAVIGRRIGDVDLLAIELGRVYLRFGIATWDLHDPDGKPWPVTSESFARLDWSKELYPLADKAADLYGDVLDPLVARLSTYSRNGSTDVSTSARTPSTSKRRKP